jgi:pectate lyase
LGSPPVAEDTAVNYSGVGTGGGGSDGYGYLGMVYANGGYRSRGSVLSSTAWGILTLSALGCLRLS